MILHQRIRAEKKNSLVIIINIWQAFNNVKSGLTLDLQLKSVITISSDVFIIRKLCLRTMKRHNVANLALIFILKRIALSSSAFCLTMLKIFYYLYEKIVVLDLKKKICKVVTSWLHMQIFIIFASKYYHMQKILHDCFGLK